MDNPWLCAVGHRRLDVTNPEGEGEGGGCGAGVGKHCHSPGALA